MFPSARSFYQSHEPFATRAAGGWALLTFATDVPYSHRSADGTDAEMPDTHAGRSTPCVPSAERRDYSQFITPFDRCTRSRRIVRTADTLRPPRTATICECGV